MTTPPPTTEPLTGIHDGQGMVLLTETEFENACRTSYDEGGLSAIDTLLLLRERHRLRWWLSSGLHHMEMLQRSMIRNMVTHRAQR